MQSLFWAVVPAAGRGTRLGGQVPKQFLDLGGRPVIAHTLAVLLEHPRITGVQLVIDSSLECWTSVLAELDPVRVRVCDGGEERMDSVLAGLRGLPPSCLDSDFVLVHDAARPLLGVPELDRLFTALDCGAEGALLALPVVDSLKRADDHEQVAASVDRSRLWRALTPQAFRRGSLAAALLAMIDARRSATDECQAMSVHGVAATLVPGDPRNFKITTAADLDLARTILAGSRKD